MDEMSLMHQIKQIDNVMQYLLLIRDEAENMENKISDTVVFLRQNGLRTETADMIQQTYMGNVHYTLDSMLDRMMKSDYVYLSDVKADLENILNR